MNIWAKNTCLPVAAVVLIAFACHAADDSLYFDVSDTGAGRQKGVVIRRSVRLDPDYYWARLSLAITNWQLRRLKEAEQQFHEALRIDPSDPFAHACLGDFLGVEKKPGAEKALKKALALEPGNEFAQYHMGKYLYNGHRDKDALPYLKKAARKGHSHAKELLAELLSDSR